MNYSRIYSDLIEKRRKESPHGYSEKHHVIPRSMGGDNSARNIVRLTAREHFIAHVLLAKIHGGNQWASVFMMMGRSKTHSRDFTIASRTYETARRHYAEVVSVESRGRAPWNKGKKTRGHPMYQSGKRGLPGGFRHSDETKSAMSASKSGKRHSMSHKSNIGASVKASHASPEMRAKISAASKAGRARKSAERAQKNIEFLAILAGLVAATNSCNIGPR